MAIQLLPLPFWAHPVWDSARSVLGPGLSGHISADLPSTWQALSRLTLFGATLILAAAVALDRGLAERSLFALTACAAIRSLELFSLGFKSNPLTPETTPLAVLECTSSMGVILAFASALLAFERFETRKTRQRHVNRRLFIALTLAAASFSICGGILLSAKETAPVLAVLLGVWAFAVLITLRRLGLRLSGILVFAMLMAAAAGSFIVLSGSIATYLTTTSTPVMAQTRLMIHDAPLTGTGAGTFCLINGLYRSVGDPVCTAAPSIITGWIVELGWPVTSLLVAEWAVLVILLIRGSLTRGRDSVYALTGTAIALSLAATCFINSGLSDPGTSVLAAALFGIAMVQRISRVKARPV